MKKIIIYVFVLLLSVVLLSCAKVTGVKKLKIGHGLDQSHPVHKAMLNMAERVKEKSNGSIQISVYPSQQLGTERECLELLQIGSLAMTKVSSSVLEGFVPIFKVFSLPYIFRSEEHKFNVFEGEVGRELLLSPEKYWLRGLCFYDAGSRSFYTKDKPINSPDDLVGLKIRTQESATSVKLVNALGGSATPISWGELYTALQQGVVDGAENNPPSFYLSRHYEVCKYYSIDEHTSVPDLLLISTVVWNELTEKEQKWVQDAADESYLYEKKLWKESTLEALKAVEEAGVIISYPDKAAFIEKVQPLMEEYKTEKEVYNLIQKIKNVK
ncbi:MAG: TRAP transporter substrate-binding protein [Bacteroidetes bacterium]|nr:TRAP transporter substrate-binding protein [Bacteroidota bacterium]MBU1117078.1 TRAP transporter substrate-binding protein [Bacteroidota bacterium]MBU1798125.1 TRAP transporter substrate-binding protein [Bacteroidota bacterium]